MYNKNKIKQGFTIVELVIAIAIVLILTLVLVPTFSNVVDKANESAFKQNAKNAYTQYMIDVNYNDSSYYYIYCEEENSVYVTIKDGVVLNVYSSFKDATKAIVGNSKYTLSEISDSLYKIILNNSGTIIELGTTISNSNIISNNNEKLTIDCNYQMSNVITVTVPKSAINNINESVNVTVTSIDPSDTIELSTHTKAIAYDIDVSNLKDNLTGDKQIEVVLNAPTALSSVKCYHNGELIDATYDEVNGTVSFKTSSFSPYAITYDEYEVSTVEELREACAIDGANIKLTADITAQMNKSMEGNYCDENHSATNSTYTYNPDTTLYFLVKTTGVDVTIDLNGHTIEVIDQMEDGNLWCSGIFFVGKDSNINILDSVGDGKVKAKGSIMIVWAPFPNSTSTDVYSGIFMSDSYVGDDIGWGYPYNEAMFYAGYDNSSVGSINIYGGYYLYNNFPNDDRNNNNGAFNVGDEATVPCIYIHDGVMLINQYWRQSTGTDDDSVFLADGCEVVEVTLDTPIVIDGVSYDTWYQVQTKAPEFETVFENTDKYLYRVGNSNEIKLSSLFKAVSPNSTIHENAKIEVKVESVDSTIKVSGTYTPASPTNWGNGTIKFTGTGLVKVTINNYELLLEVVDGKNVTNVSELDSGKNNILLNDITIKSGGSFGVGNKTLYGNGFTFDIKGGTHAGNTQGVVTLAGGTIDNISIIGDIYTTYVDAMKEEYYNSAVACVGGNNKILNSYISGCRTALRCATSSGSVYVENTTLSGGRLANALIVSGTLTLKNVTTVSEKQTVDGQTYLGFGVLVHEDANQDVRVNIEGDLTQYNWVSKDDKSYLPGSAANYVDTAFGYTQFVYNYDGTDYVNLGIISISGKVLSDKIKLPTGYSAQNIGSNACVVSCDNSIDSTRLNNGVPLYGGYQANAYSPVPPTFTWNYPGEYNSANNTIQVTFEEGSSYELNPNILTAKKNDSNLDIKVTMDGVDYTDKTITFTESGEHILKYTVTDKYNYNCKGEDCTYDYSFEINVNVIVTASDAKHAEFTYTDGSATKIEEIDGKKYVMPDVTSTSDTIASVTVSGTTVYMPIVTALYKDNSSDFNGYAPIFTAINITDYAGGVNTGTATTYNTSTKTLPSTWGKSSGEPYIGGAASKTDDPVTYNSYGLCYESLKGSNISEHTQTVCFYYTDNAGETYYYYIQYKFEAHNKPSSCITSDTLITLSDGTQKRVDELNFNDKVLVWNFFTSNYDIKDISILVNHGYDYYDVIYLNYSDGTILKLIDEHGIFDYDLNCYVYISEDNINDYINHRFVKQNINGNYDIVTLTSARVKKEYIEAWSISSSETSNVFASGLLTVAPPDIFYNWITMGDKLQYDVEQLENDIEMYGLYTYEDFKDYVSYEQYVAFNGAYLKIPVSKGIFTFEYIIDLIELYIQYMPQ